MKMMSHKQKIDPKLEVLLDELRDVPARDPRRAAQGRAQFLSQAVSVRTQAVSRSPIVRLNRWFDKLKQPKEKKTMTTFASILAILALLTGGGAGTVYAAQDSMPNEMLYSVKIASEEFRLNMADDPAQQLNLLLEFSERRGDEIETMLAEGEEPPAEALLKLNLQTQQAMQLASTLDGAAQLQVQNMIQNQMQRMLNLQDNASEEGVVLMEQARVTLQNQLMLMGAGQGQVTDEIEEALSEDETVPESQGQGQGQGQAQGQEQSQGQGPSDGGAQDTVTPAGPENGQGQQNSNQGVDPCIAYYEALAKAQGQSQSQGKGQGDGNGSK